MKKVYIAPEMEILDAELEGFLAASGNDIKEDGDLDVAGGRQYGGGFDFDEFDDFEEDEY